MEKMNGKITEYQSIITGFSLNRIQDDFYKLLIDNHISQRSISISIHLTTGLKKNLNPLNFFRIER